MRRRPLRSLQEVASITRDQMMDIARRAPRKANWFRWVEGVLREFIRAADDLNEPKLEVIARGTNRAISRGPADLASEIQSHFDGAEELGSKLHDLLTDPSISTEADVVQFWRNWLVNDA